jgi:molybdopterin molybdotransferase
VRMISFDEALAHVQKHCVEGRSEQVSVEHASERILFSSFAAQVDLPPFTTSSVDGYAVQVPCARRLKIVGELPAGPAPSMTIGHPEVAVQVFTGSRLPNDTGAVVMLEDTLRDGQEIELTASPVVGDNVRRQGEEIRRGDLLLEKGKRLIPPAVALLASSGQSKCDVYKKPRVSVVETGTELRSSGEILGKGEIYAANGVALSAAARELGAEVSCYRCSDDLLETERVLAAASENADFLITSGGVSVGKHDRVREVWKNLGAQEMFWRVAIRPGRPIFFASIVSGPVIFGLPGNPVSSLVTFHLFVRPALLKYYGNRADAWERGRTSYPLIPNASVEVFERVSLQDGVLYPISQQGSHMSSGLAVANALVRIPPGSAPLPVGSRVRISHLTWTMP